MTPDEEQKSGRDAYWRARESADAAREGTDTSDDSAEPAAPAYGPDEADPDTTTAADYPSESTRSPMAPPALQTSAPSAPAATDDVKARKFAALDEAKRLAYAPVGDPNAGKELAAAQGRDREQRGKDAFTEALQAWLQRRPQRITPPTEAADLEKRQALDQSSAVKQRGQQLSVQEQIAKALTEPKSTAAPAITPYQQEELKLRREGIDRGAEQKQSALADRKRTMLSLYPEHKTEIDALTDLGDAQTLQTALEGRLGRAETQTHADQAAVTASDRSFQNALKLKEWERTHQNLTAEQKAQLEGIEKSDSAIDTFEGGMGSTSTFAGKLGASSPKIAGALGAPGADFQSLREGTAIALARGLEGGMARPGNVEIIQHMLPEASDSEVTKRQKLAHVREFVKNNRDAFQAAAEQTGAVMKPMAPAAPRAAEQQPPKPAVRPAGVPEGAKHINGKWMWRRPDGEVAVVEG